MSINFCLEQKSSSVKRFKFMFYYPTKSHESIDLQEQIEGMIGRIPEVFDDTAEKRREFKGQCG